MRRHPLLPRIGAVLGGLIVLAGLVALARYRPPLPHISSITGPFTATALRDLLLGLAWLLSKLLLIDRIYAHGLDHPVLIGRIG